MNKSNTSNTEPRSNADAMDESSPCGFQDSIDIQLWCIENDDERAVNEATINSNSQSTSLTDSRSNILSSWFELDSEEGRVQTSAAAPAPSHSHPDNISQRPRHQHQRGSRRIGPPPPPPSIK